MNRKLIAYIYFLSFTVIGTLFGLNLLIGVIFSNFDSMKKIAESENLTENQMNWIKMHDTILKTHPFSFSYPKKGKKIKILNFIEHKNFQNLFRLCLYFDVFLIMLYYDDSPIIYNIILDKILIFITFIYLFEVLSKIIAMGSKFYFSFKFHRIDVLIVISYACFIIFANFNYYYSSKNYFNYKYYLKSIFYITRVLGFFRIINRIKGLKIILNTLFFSLPLIFNMIMLFFINLVIYSVIGCHLFKNVKNGVIINEYVNFENAINSFGTLLKCSLCDDWQYIMFDVSKVDNCEKNYDCGSS